MAAVVINLLETSSDMKKLGGALFCDRRYDTVFLYHNGADSYYGARAFRGSLGVETTWQRAE